MLNHFIFMLVTACKNRRHVQGCGIHSALNRPRVQGTQPEQLIFAGSQRYKPYRNATLWSQGNIRQNRPLKQVTDNMLH